MTVQELRDRVAQLTQVRDQQIAQTNMVIGRLQESQERLALAEAKEAEAAKSAATPAKKEKAKAVAKSVPPKAVVKSIGKSKKAPAPAAAAVA